MNYSYRWDFSGFFRKKICKGSFASSDVFVSVFLFALVSVKRC